MQAAGADHAGQARSVPLGGTPGKRTHGPAPAWREGRHVLDGADQLGPGDLPLRGPAAGPAAGQVQGPAATFTYRVGPVKQIGQAARVRGDAGLARQPRRSERGAASTGLGAALPGPRHARIVFRAADHLRARLPASVASGPPSMTRRRRPFSRCLPLPDWACLCRSGAPRGTWQACRALPMVADADGITADDTPAVIPFTSQAPDILSARVRTYPPPTGGRKRRTP